MGTQNADRSLELTQQYVTPSYPDGMYLPHNYINSDTGGRPSNLPVYYPNGTSQLPVSYVGPSAAKDNMARRQAVRDGINNAVAALGAPPGVQRTDPITDEEVQYLKYMEDTSELAKFDQYVESFIDPRQPGSMKFLMEVYPEYVNRRLQQAHADYEYALRNQMIDSWGINTFDDLYFKYMVDQGKLEGPQLIRPGRKLADKYAPGILSHMAFATKFDRQDRLGLPFTSAKTGVYSPCASLVVARVSETAAVESDRRKRTTERDSDAALLRSYGPVDRRTLYTERGGRTRVAKKLKGAGLRC